MRDVYLHTVFPTTIYHVQELISEEYNQEIIERCLEIEKSIESTGKYLLAEIYTTFGTQTLTNDPIFKNLNIAVTENVNNFAKLNESYHSFIIDSSWINVGREHSYQEFHDHRGHNISCCYYASVPKHSGKIVFENINSGVRLKETMRDNEYNIAAYSIMPKPRSLLIFRSHVRHMVTMGKNKEPRISIAYNF